jgi:hypothetical protein
MPETAQTARKPEGYSRESTRKSTRKSARKSARKGHQGGNKFIMFLNETQPIIKKQNPTWNSAKVVKECQRRWDELPEEKKQAYKDIPQKSEDEDEVDYE